MRVEVVALVNMTRDNLFASVTAQTNHNFPGGVSWVVSVGLSAESVCLVTHTA